MIWNVGRLHVRNGFCRCPSGSVPRDASRCQLKLARIYRNWTYANASGDFCTDSNGCLDSSAFCQIDLVHPERFCQCPSTYTANYEAQRCELKVYNGLSPSITPLSNDTCGKCQAENALCVPVDQQVTCWCRAGYVKVGDRCGQSKNFIFPNRYDIYQYKYSANCSIYDSNHTITESKSLCTCAPGYQFVDKYSSCQPIKPVWINENFEYGVCTRINSDEYNVEEFGLCPHPLSCVARQDKFVCTCGQNYYLDEKTNTCLYLLETNLTSPNASQCPPHSNLTGSACRCTPTDVFTVSTDKRRCQLTLNSLDINTDCVPSNTTYDQSCAGIYGGNAKFCRQGECRCLLNSSYHLVDKCVTLISADAGTNVICPPNAKIDSDNRCTCNDGFRPDEDKHSCKPIVRQLNQAVSPDLNLTDADCQALFSRHVIASNDACVCENGTFSIIDITCVFYLGYTPLPADTENINCPLLASVSGGNETENATCECDFGYKEANPETCVRKTSTVYAHNDTTGVPIPELRTEDCQALFDNTVEASGENGFCRCRNGNIAFFDGGNCYFLVETSIPEPFSAIGCPPNTQINGRICQCSAGYRASSGNQGCERKPIYSTNLQLIDRVRSQVACNATYTDADCEALHGPGAVCSDNKCYCDRYRSFVRDNQCVPYTRFVFPGAHERHLYTCEVNEDCGSDAAQKNIDCGLISIPDSYTVCKCKSGYTFNPTDSTCVPIQCIPQCSDTEDCSDYQCICKPGHYRNSEKQCVKFDLVLKLHERCNQSYFSEFISPNEPLECSYSCDRLECRSDYQLKDSQCVKPNFDDRCAHNIYICQEFTTDAICSRDENKCVCSSNSYRTNDEQICARSINSACTTNNQCGALGQCIQRQCQCRAGSKEEETEDYLGRKIKRCVNGIDQIRFNPTIFFFIIFARLFLA